MTLEISDYRQPQNPGGASWEGWLQRNIKDQVKSSWSRRLTWIEEVWRRRLLTFARWPLRRHSGAGVKGGDCGDGVVTRPPGAPLLRRAHGRFLNYLRRAGVWRKKQQNPVRNVLLFFCFFIISSQKKSLNCPRVPESQGNKSGQHLLMMTQTDQNWSLTDA